MISLSDVYHVVAATVPLYVAMMLAYISVKWWKFFTAEQCSGINKFVAKFSIPLLSFQVISDNNLYKMNLQLILADFLQKILAIILLGAITKITSRGGLNWIITGLSLSTMPNTLILGLPVLKAMYGSEADVLLAQIVVLQSILWYNILLFLFEFTTTKAASLAPASEATGRHWNLLSKNSNKENKITSTQLYKSFMCLLGTSRNKNGHIHTNAMNFSNHPSLSEMAVFMLSTSITFLHPCKTKNGNLQNFLLIASFPVS